MKRDSRQARRDLLSQILRHFLRVQGNRVLQRERKEEHEAQEEEEKEREEQADHDGDEVEEDLRYVCTVREKFRKVKITQSLFFCTSSG